MSGGCFSVLVISNFFMRTGLLLPHMLELDFILFSEKHVFVVFVVFFSNQKKGGGRCIFFQISYVFLPDISANVH